MSHLIDVLNELLKNQNRFNRTLSGEELSTISQDFSSYRQKELINVTILNIFL